MKRLKITVNGVAYDVTVEEQSNTAPVAAPAAVAAPVVAAPAAPAAPAPTAAPAGGEVVSAPMPGNVLDVAVSAGDTVKKGQVLLILEAMKMENEIFAPRDGVVATVYARKGESVDTGAPLVSLQ